MRRTASLLECLLSGRQLALIASTICVSLMTPIATAQHSPGKILYKRTDGLNVSGDDFTGALPENSDHFAPFGTPDDPGSSVITAINVDREPGGGGIDLTGDNHDLAFTLQFHDADGVFSFTENYDNRVQIVITPITGPNDLTTAGTARTHADSVPNSRTNASFDFGAGGWFNADVHMTEDVGAAQSAADIGFGYSNEESETVGLQQISPDPTSYFEVVDAGTLDPAPPGMDFARFAANWASEGDVTASIQLVPGVGDVGDFGNFVAGNIALIDRGVIRFDDKVANAQNNGAIGVLIANTDPSAVPGLFQGGGDPGKSTIPALMIRHGLGVDLKAQLAGGDNVVMRIATVPAPPPTQFGGIGYTSTFGISSDAPAVFDPDPANNNWSFGAYLDSFDPTIDTDGDDIPDGFEELFFPGDLTQLGPGDFDNDGLTDKEEFDNGTDPTKEDTDDDGLTDMEEAALGTNPRDPDSDDDGLTDGEENSRGTDPNNWDTDGGGVSDGKEVELGTNPLNGADDPRSVLLAYWDFEGETDEERTEDKSGNEVHATLQGDANTDGDPAPVNYPNARSLDLGALANGAAATTEPGPHFDSAFDKNAMAVSFWQFNTQIGNSSAFWIHSQPAGSNDRGFQAHTPWGDGTVYFDQSGCCGTPNQRLTVGGAVILNQWQHFVFQRDEDGNQEIWIDGALAANQSGNEPLDAFNGIITIGAEGNNLNNSFSGLIDELAVFDGPLSPERIADLAAGEPILVIDLDFLKLAVGKSTDGLGIELSFDTVPGLQYDVLSEVPTGDSPPVLPAPAADWPEFLTYTAIPAVAGGGRQTVFIPWTDLTGDDERYFAIRSGPTPPLVVYSDDGESGQGSSTVVTDGPGATQWELGAPAPNLVGNPSAAHGGANCWGTDLDANYAEDTLTRLRTGPIDLSPVASASLTYWEWRDIEVTFDKGTVRLLDASDLSEIAILEDDIDGTSTDWEEVTLDFPPEANGKTVIVEWILDSDNFQQQAGWLLDDISVFGPGN